MGAVPTIGLVRRIDPLPGSCLVRAVLVVLAVAGVAAPTRAEEIPFGWSVSSTTTLSQWRDFFNSDLRELRSRAYSTTYYDDERTKPVSLAGVSLDARSASPVYTDATIRTVVLPGDPEYGTIRVESASTTARGRLVKSNFTLQEKSLDAPIVVGPLEGIAVTPPPHEEIIEGKRFVFRTVSRTAEVVAILVAPTFEDLLLGRNIQEIRTPGTRLEAGSLRVLSPEGQPNGFFAGDVRIAYGEDYVGVEP